MYLKINFKNSIYNLIINCKRELILKFCIFFHNKTTNNNHNQHKYKFYLEECNIDKNYFSFPLKSK
jgi:hypothetical protein